MQVKQIINQTYPRLAVYGSEYPIDSTSKLIGQVISMLQYLLYAILLFGDNIFEWIGMGEPKIYQKVKNNRWYYFILVLFVGNGLSNYFLSSGAFEIYLGDDLVFSKLKIGRMPQVEDFLPVIKILLK